MDKIADVIRIFIEKHLIPSVISITVAIIALLLMPEDNWIIVKIGKMLVFILAFCITFLIIQILILLINAIKNIIRKRNELYHRKKLNKAEKKEAIDQINEFVDQLTPDDKKILITFIRNGNKTLIALDRVRSDSFNVLLYNTKIMNIASYYNDIPVIDTTRYWMTSDLEQMLNQGMRPIGEFKQYRIKDNVFHDLELVYKTTGKLGNF